MKTWLLLAFFFLIHFHVQAYIWDETPYAIQGDINYNTVFFIKKFTSNYCDHRVFASEVISANKEIESAIVWGSCYELYQKKYWYHEPRWIRSASFENCSRLKFIMMPPSICEIESGAFSGCDSIQVVMMTGDVPEIYPNAFPSNTIIYVPYNTNQKYCQDTNWSRYNIIPYEERIGPFILNNIGTTNADLSICKVWGSNACKISDSSIYPLQSNHGKSGLYDMNQLVKVVANGETFLINDKNEINIGNLNPSGLYSRDDNSSLVNEIDVYYMSSNNSGELFGEYNQVEDNYKKRIEINTKKLQCYDVTKPDDITQSTATLSFDIYHGGMYSIDKCGVDISVYDISSSFVEFECALLATDSLKHHIISSLITPLSFDSRYQYHPWILFRNKKCYLDQVSFSFWTKPIEMGGDFCVGPSSIICNLELINAGDVKITDYFISFNKNNYKNLSMCGLEPQTYYKSILTYVYDNYQRNYDKSFTTPALSMKAKAADMITNKDARLMAETNMADIETSCGFEWRRYDAPEEMPSAKVYCPVYDGVMAGTLKNMSENVYYKYRPFYKSSAGNEYYGDWVAFITADAGVEFDPVVHTYNSPAVTQTEATLQGVALRGSEEITEQGFEYWRTGNNNLLAAANGVTKVTAKGERMSKTISDLKAGTRYTFRAYVIAGGETTYGEEVSFTTIAGGCDVNSDGEVNIADINVVIDMILSTSLESNGDVNGDGEINIADINALIDAILSK